MVHLSSSWFNENTSLFCLVMIQSRYDMPLISHKTATSVWRQNEGAIGQYIKISLFLLCCIFFDTWIMRWDFGYFVSNIFNYKSTLVIYFLRYNAKHFQLAWVSIHEYLEHYFILSFTNNLVTNFLSMIKNNFQLNEWKWTLKVEEANF